MYGVFVLQEEQTTLEETKIVDQLDVRTQILLVHTLELFVILLPFSLPLVIIVLFLQVICFTQVF